MKAMKSSLQRLRSLALSKYASNSKLSVLPGPPAIHEILSTIKVAEDMKEQYDNILAAAQTILGSIFDLSHTMDEMTTYMVEIFEKTADGETVHVFKMMAKVQYELSKLLDVYASYVSQTFVRPIENLLEELDFIEDIKLEYEDKRKFYDEITAQKKKSKGVKGDTIREKSSMIKDQLREQAMQLDTRLMSLMHGQKRNLVMQAIQHYTAQCHFFNKGLNCLNAAGSIAKDLSQSLKIDDMLDDDIERAPECASNISCQIKMQEIKADSRKIDQMHVKHNNSAPVCLSPTRNTVDIEKISLQNFPLKESTKYALPNPNSATSRRHNESDIIYPNSATLRRTNKVATQGTGRNHSSSQSRSGLSMHLPKLQLKDASSASNCSHSGPLPGKCNHTRPFPTPNMYNKHTGNILGLDPQHKRSSAPMALAAPRISPSASFLPGAPTVGHFTPINELHKLPTPPHKAERFAQYSAPPRDCLLELDQESFAKSPPAFSTSAILKNKHFLTGGVRVHHRSYSVDTPIVELPP